MSESPEVRALCDSDLLKIAPITMAKNRNVESARSGIQTIRARASEVLLYVSGKWLIYVYTGSEHQSAQRRKK